MKKLQKRAALVLALAMAISPIQALADEAPAAAAEKAAPEDGYIAAPYTAADAKELTAQFLDPVYYENEDGPTIGVTLLGVVVKDGKYFRDLNNNKELDDFEDWRLPAEERAAAYAKTLTDEQLSYQLLNIMMYSSKSTKVEDVVDENGKPVWAKMYTGGTDDDPTSIVTYWETAGFRNFVVRNNAAPEVGVWFNNGLEQYAEYDAVQHGTTAVPFLSFTNPIRHGMPGTEGVTAAVLGDGNADLVLKDAQLDRVMMWTKGIDGIYGPQIDLVTDPRWSRNTGTYGEREDTAAEIARALTIGFQNGDQGMVPGSVLLTVKHFPGDGAAYNGFESHGYTGRYRVYSTENSLADYQLKPFIAAFEAGAAGVMPGYSQPIIDERIAPQSITYNGKTYDIKLEGYGNAFNESVLQYLLREVLGFEGLINSDSVSQSNAHGVEEMTGYEQTVLYVNAGCQAGVFAAAGAMGRMTISPELIYEALQKGDITRETLEAAAAGRAKPRMQSGDMENPYRDLETSVKEYNAAKEEATKLAAETHLKSVVLMKNSEAVLPLTDMGKKVYLQAFNQRGNANVEGITASLQAQGYTIVTDYKEADVAFLIVNPTIVGQGSGNLAVLDLVEDVETPVFDNNAKPKMDEDGKPAVANITTVAGMADFQKIADEIHAKGGKVIGQIEASNAWILTNMEPYCDALIGTFNTSTDAVAKVVAGKYNPTGKLPITMVADASVIALVTTQLGEETWEVCVSPNDVPGYVKDQYIAKEVLEASPSGSYAYKDAAGNLYFSGFGLSYEGMAPGSQEAPEEEAGAEAGEANTALNYDSVVTDLEGDWTLSKVVVEGKAYNAVADAANFKVTKELDDYELVDTPNYIHNQVYNFSGKLYITEKSAKEALEEDDVEFYKGTNTWEDFPQGKISPEGEFYKQPGPTTMNFKDIDDYGLFLKEIAGVESEVDTTNKKLILGLNADGQLLLGYSEEHIERPGTEGEWEYVLVFDRQ